MAQQASTPNCRKTKRCGQCREPQQANRGDDAHLYHYLGYPLFLPGLSVVAVASGATDTLKASHFLGLRS
jgi:hypothetical protein